MERNELFAPGMILKIREFVFDDDGSTRDKYCIVLHHNQEHAYIIHSLTTSKKHTDKDKIYNGCNVEDGVPFYHFGAKVIVGQKGFYFDVDTYMFFAGNVRKQVLSAFDEHLKASYIMPIDSLEPGDLSRLLKCILKSKALPIGIKKELLELRGTSS